MTPYCELGKEELLELKKELTQKYEDAKGKGLKLDMSRGKPSTDQLELRMSGGYLQCQKASWRYAGRGSGACDRIWYGQPECNV